ncbi:oligosaccharide flippase family protein [Gracilimonas sp.]|uniref:oligosaccharide flippase family protein n=1 Tax=Gracilimonas sp. TaxID=1974203 RepID=UPI003D0F197E
MIKKLYKNNRDALNYFIVVLFQSGLQLLIVPIITALLSTDEYSEYSLANTIFGILVVITQFGVLNTYSVLYYKSESKWVLTTNVILIYLLNSIVLSAIFIAGYYISGIELLDVNFIIFILCAVSIEVLFELFRTNLRLEFLSVKYLYAMIIKLVGYNALFIYLMYFHEYDGRAKFIGLICITALILTAVYISQREKIKFTDLNRKLIKEIYRKSSAIAPGQIAKTIQNSFDIFVVFYLIGKTEFALFAIAIQLSRPLERFSASLMDSYIPQLYKSLSKNEHPSTLDKTNKIKYLLLVGSVAVVVILFSPLLFQFLVSNEFLREAVVIFPFLIGGRFIYSIAQYHESVIIYNEKYIYSSIVNIINVLLMILIFYFFTLKFSVLGIGYAYLLIKMLHYLLIVMGYKLFDIAVGLKWDHISIIVMIMFVFIYHL